MNSLIIRDMIKNGSIIYKVGDRVVLFRRKGSGYPKGVNDGEVYIIRRVECESIEIISELKSEGPNLSKYFDSSIKVHKSYMIPIYLYRDIKINSIIG